MFFSEEAINPVGDINLSHLNYKGGKATALGSHGDKRYPGSNILPQQQSKKHVKQTQATQEEIQLIESVRSSSDSI